MTKSTGQFSGITNRDKNPTKVPAIRLKELRTKEIRVWLLSNGRAEGEQAKRLNPVLITAAWRSGNTQPSVCSPTLLHTSFLYSSRIGKMANHSQG